MAEELEEKGGAAVDEPGELVTQFTVMLQNKTGALGAIVGLLHSNGVEVLGMSIQDSRDATTVRLVVSCPDTTHRVFGEKGICYAQSDLVVVAMRNVQGELVQVLAALRAAETNIDFLYALLPHPEGKSLMALHLEDAYFGVDVLAKAGVKVLYQQDLSR